MHRTFIGLFYVIRHFFRWVLFSVIGIAVVIGLLFWAFILIEVLPWVGVFVSVCIGIGLVIGAYRSWKIVQDARREEELQRMARGRVRGHSGHSH